MNDTFVTDIKAKAKIFNKFFSKQCTPLENDTVLPTSQNVLTQSRLHSIDSRFEEISKIVRSLGDISVSMVKILDNSLVRPLSLLLKKLFGNSFFHELWKKLNIIPVHKKMTNTILKIIAPFHYSLFSVKHLKKIIQYMFSLKTNNF